MNNKRAKQLRKYKRRIEHRLREIHWSDQAKPMFSASNIHYEISDKARAIVGGGIGAMQALARETGLIAAIDAHLHLLKVHLPYHESDHVLNIAFNFLCGHDRMEDLEILRHDEAYMDALGADRIPDPTTAGDFCRRFSPLDIEVLHRAIDEVRLKIWGCQPAAFFDEALIDIDGKMVETDGECKEGMGMDYKGRWGFKPVLVSLANTSEPLRVRNHPGHEPSHVDAADALDEAIALCREAEFKTIYLRGDTEFGQGEALDGWDGEGVKFVFGWKAHENVVALADGLSKRAWTRLERPHRPVKTEPRDKPENVKERIVKEKEYENIRLRSEDVAEFPYSPGACEKTYRMIVVRKNLTVEKGEWALFDDIRYFFYLTNDRRRSAQRLVLMANGRCDQENLIAQLGGMRALHAPVDNLTSNGAYMVMASLAWTLKSWFALMLPETGRWKEKHKPEKQAVLRMEFKTFLHAFMLVPAQIVRQGRRTIYRLLSWNPWQEVFFRAWDRISLGRILV